MKLTIVLGKRLNNDSTMKEELINRLNRGIEVYFETNSDYLVLTGGIPNKIAKVSEASQMFSYVLSKKFPQDKVILEDKSKTTYGNALYIKKMLKNENIEIINLVSSSYHFERKSWNCFRIFKRIFKKVEIVPFKVD